MRERLHEQVAFEITSSGRVSSEDILSRGSGLSHECLEKLRNYHSSEETKKTWEPNAISDFGLDRAMEKESQWTNWKSLHRFCGLVNILYPA